MDQKKNLTVEISARVKELLGTEELENKFRQIEEKINEPLPDVSKTFEAVRQSQTYQQFQEESETLPFWQKLMQAPAGLLGAETEKLDENIDRVRQRVKTEIEGYIASGTEPKKPTVDKYNRWFANLEGKIDEVFGRAIDRINEKLEGARTEGEAGMLEQEMLAVEELRDKYKDAVTTQKEGLDQLLDSTKKATDGVQSFVDVLSKLGILGFASQMLLKGVDLSTRYGVLEEQIAKRYGTAFDLGSPIGTYSQQEQAQLFDVTSRRSFEAEVTGTAVGGAVGGGLGALAFLIPGIGTAAGVASVLGGSMFGQAIGSKIFGREAEEQNIAEQEALERELNYINQAYGIISQNVQGYRQLDVAETQLRARLGENTNQRYLRDLGFQRTEEAQLKGSFAEQYGRFDEQLFREQTEAARATGLEPEHLYQFGRISQFTGLDYDQEQIAQADVLRRTLYGDDSDSKKIIEVLQSIRGIQERLLQTNIDADAKRANDLANLPALLFGTDNPYGRIDQLGGKTLDLLEGIMQPKSMAHEAFLFNAFGRPDLEEFTELKKGGFAGLMQEPDRMKDLFGFMQNVGDQIHPFHLYAILNQMMPDAPKGFVPQIRDLFAEGQTTVKNRDGEEVTITIDEILNPERNKEKIEALMQSYEENAEKFTSESSRIMTAVSDTQMEIGERWNALIGEMEIRTQQFINDMSDIPETVKRITDAFEEGLMGLKNHMDKMTQEEYLLNKVEEFIDRDLSEGERRDLRFSSLGPFGTVEDYRQKLAEKAAEMANERAWYEPILEGFLDRGYEPDRKLLERREAEELERNKKTEKAFLDLLESRGTGGAVDEGKPYRVGEFGEEVFVPGQSGYVIPSVNLIPDEPDYGDDKLSYYKPEVRVYEGDGEFYKHEVAKSEYPPIEISGVRFEDTKEYRIPDDLKYDDRSNDKIIAVLQELLEEVRLTRVEQPSKGFSRLGYSDSPEFDTEEIWEIKNKINSYL